MSSGSKHLCQIVGAYEHPGRHLPDRTLVQIHTDVALGALRDAGLTMNDVDSYFCAGDAPGFGGISMADYWGLNVRYTDTTETGGSSYLAHVGHAAAAIAARKCHVALITLAGKPRTGGQQAGRSGASSDAPEAAFESQWGSNVPNMYAQAAARHMYEYGTTSAQLAMIKVVASQHASHNPNAFLRNEVTVQEVLDSPMVADPLHRLDCCVVTDGGGALIVVSPEVARSLTQPERAVNVLGHGEALKHSNNGRIDLTHTGAVWSGPAAFAEARVTPKDIQYASIYDSFTITVLETLEDLGFCEKGSGGRFVESGALMARGGSLPFNTDGGGLSNNHPGNRGGMTKVIEAVRQLRGEAHPEVQVANCELALAHGTGGNLGTRSGSATLILGRS